MIARIDFQSGVPVYLQIVQQVKVAAATGLIRSGDPLPSVRALAEDLRINRNTDKKSVFEGRAETVSNSNNLTRLVPNLVTAMFTNFPGSSGETVRVRFDPAKPEFADYPSKAFLIAWAERLGFSWHIEQDIFVARR